MKKALFGLPALALVASVVILAAQAANGSTATSFAPVAESDSAKAERAQVVPSDNPAVFMQDWQVTAKKTRGSTTQPQ